MQVPVTRKNAPYLAHPVLGWYFLLGPLLTLPGLIRTARPSWLELTIGLVTGLLSGAVGSEGIVRMLTYFASQARDDPRMKWFSLAWPLWGGGGILAAMLFAVCFFAGGSAAPALTDCLARHLRPLHPEELAATRLLIPGVPMSMGHPALPLFSTAFATALGARMLHWYYRLPR